MVDKDSLSYKRGFAKGIEIYTENMSKGFYADEDNRKCVGAFKYYANTGIKKGVKLNDGQRQFFYGMADGIEYKYKKAGTPLFTNKSESKFEKREKEHYYGNDDNYDVDAELFG
mgnify:CR=1 FL=1